MPAARTSFDDLAPIADAAVGALDFRGALNIVIHELGRRLQVPAYVVELVDRDWSVVAQPASSTPLPHALVAKLPILEPFPVARRDAAGGDWMALSLSLPGTSPLALIVRGDWSDQKEALASWSRLMAFAIAAVRERDLRRQMEEHLVSGYAMTRRLSRLGTVEAVSQRIVGQVARLVGADRVAMALHRSTDDFLAITATHGYALSSVDQLRIQPGSWVLGHVYATGRPVLVRDVHQVPAMAHADRGYRTGSFAAVPMFAGKTIVGVLAATDKTDGSAFTRQDLLMLRTASVAAGMAVAAARSQTEAGRLAYAATVDALTGLLNRTYLDGRLHQEFERARRAANPLAVVMADVDDFKIINDTYGHQIGDAVLQVVGAIIRSAVRVFDVCARYGGDEFAILMPSTDHASAFACAERIRRRVSEYRSDPLAPVVPSLTMSIGVAVIEGGDTPAELILRADRALYQAKAAGKNCVRVHSGRAGGSPSAILREPDVHR
jgi:diguanylate cyclase (GGDEF)-like protein